MAIVAIAGGTGGVGKTIQEELQLVKRHRAIVLCRKVLEKEYDDGQSFVYIDYDDVDAIVVKLDEHKIDTIICTIGLRDAAASRSQLNLIEAAKRSKQTRRFIPSEFTFPIEDSNEQTRIALAFWLDAAAKLQNSSLQYTRFTNGWFMDYFGIPGFPSNLSSHVWAIDVAQKRAAIPGTGNELLTLTHSKDVARFVIRLLDEKHWPERSYLSGSDTTFNEMLLIAEQITGEKFKVTYDDEDKLGQGKATMLSDGYGAGKSSTDEAQAMVSMFGRMAVEGRLLVPSENRMNGRYPELQPLDIRTMMAQAWASN